MQCKLGAYLVVMLKKKRQVFNIFQVLNPQLFGVIFLESLTLLPGL